LALFTSPHCLEHRSNDAELHDGGRKYIESREHTNSGETREAPWLADDATPIAFGVANAAHVE